MSDPSGSVLVVNSDYSLAEAIHKILSKEGYRVFYVPDFNQVSSRLKKEKFSLVIADLNQIELSGGKSLTQTDWKIWPPVILLTDYLETNFTGPLSRTLKKSSFLKKPVSRERLLEAVREIEEDKTKESGCDKIGGNGSPELTKEIRIHGRGGQGVVTAAELVALAAFEDGKYATAFPSFGSERMGAPVQSFVRISSLPIRDRSQIQNPDIVIIQDPTLIGVVNLAAGLKAGGIIMIDTEKSPQELGLDFSGTVVTVPASKIALEKIGRPIQNTTLVGALAGATGLISWESVKKSILKRFPGELGDKNVASAWEAYEMLGNKYAEKQNLHS